jgi:predicted amidohydrolase YtcJ
VTSVRIRAQLACLLFAATAAATGAEPATTIYVGGDILTMKGPRPTYVEALAVRNGRISAVGTRDAVMRLTGPGTELVDLKGRTLLPGFIDAHGHVPDYVTTWGLPELAPPPVGTVRSIADLQRAFREHLAKTPPAPGQTLVGSGYDDSLLAERRHPTRTELDAISAEVPIVARHASGHLLVANSAAIAKAGITRDTKDPEGGVMRRSPDGELDGTMEEQAMLPFLAALKPPDPEEWTRPEDVPRLRPHHRG